MGRSVRVLLAVVITISALLIGMVPAAAAGATVYVNSDGYCGGSTPCYTTIQAAIGATGAGDTIVVGAGSYLEAGQIVISKNLTIVGAGTALTTIRPDSDTTTPGGGSAAPGDSSGWILVQSGVSLDLSGVTLDGAGKNIGVAVLAYGSGDIHDNVITNIAHGVYRGFGVMLWNSTMSVTDNTFTNIRRIGVLAKGASTDATISGNTYVGKGASSICTLGTDAACWLDYGIEVGASAKATITGNTISDCLGVAYDGSTSGGILVSDYYGVGTRATISGNTITDCSTGVIAGYTSTDTSVVTATGNSFSGNDVGVASNGPLVTATGNWWGDVTGPNHTTNPNGLGDAVTDAVIFSPWANETLTTDYYLVGGLYVDAPTAAYLGTEFDVAVKVDGVTDLAGYAVDIAFDKALLEVVSVTPDASFDWSTGYKAASSVWDNNLGTIHWEVTTSLGGASPDGTVTLMTIAFRPKANGVAAIGIGIGRLLTNISADVLVPASTSDDSVTIGDMPVVSGTVALQGRATAGSGGGTDYSGTVVTLNGQSVTTGADGSYTFSTVPGTYDIVIEHSSYLDTWSTITVPITGEVATQSLSFGDINDDEKVNIQDLAFIAYRYGASTGGAKWDARADMNLDGTINVFDLTGAAGNYGDVSIGF